MKIIMFSGDGISSYIMYNALKKDFIIDMVVLEPKKNLTLKFLKRRIKKLGFINVIGQIVFKIYNKLFLQNKTSLIKLQNKLELDTSFFPEKIISRVNSINDEKVIKILKNHSPDIIIVNGTSIISNKILSATNAIFINAHAGITPKYRGVHGAYWALVNNDKKNAGSTVHLVDEGIDTGNIIYQDTIHISEEDNFNTYPLKQIALSARLMKKTINDIEKNKLNPYNKNDSESKLYTHPTLFKYLKYRILNGIK